MELQGQPQGDILQVEVVEEEMILEQEDLVVLVVEVMVDHLINLQ
jgi:hypothetical protein